MAFLGEQWLVLLSFLGALTLPGGTGGLNSKLSWAKELAWVKDKLVHLITEYIGWHGRLKPRRVPTQVRS